MLKAVKKSSEVNKSKLKLAASNGNEQNNNNNNNGCNSINNKNNNNIDNNDKSNISESSGMLEIKRGSISGHKSEGSPHDSTPLKKLSLKGNQLCGSILIGNYNVRFWR